VRKGRCAKRLWDRGALLRVGVRLCGLRRGMVGESDFEGGPHAHGRSERDPALVARVTRCAGASAVSPRRVFLRSLVSAARLERKWLIRQAAMTLGQGRR